jgi:hypothetical protein
MAKSVRMKSPVDGHTLPIPEQYVKARLAMGWTIVKEKQK